MCKMSVASLKPFGSGRLASGIPTVSSLQGFAGVQVLVATAPMCWGMTAAAALVVIMGTQYYDASGATSGADYSVTDLLQMMGRASRPDIDEVGRCAAARPTAILPRCLRLRVTDR